MHELTQQILNCLPIDKWQDFRVILAVSGGADSTALVRLVHQITQQFEVGPIHVAHANHQMRGVESDQDERFVAELAKEAGFDFATTRLPLEQSQQNEGIESALRELRYGWLKKLAGDIGARYLFTAHNQNDQTETILFRLMRGTGIAGLAGIPDARLFTEGTTLVRPMLNISRHQIVDFLNEIRQPFRMDKSNDESTFARNKIRNKLLPLIRNEFSPGIDERLSVLAQQASEYQDWLDKQCEPFLEAAFEFGAERVEAKVSNLPVAESLLLRHLLIKIWQKMSWPLRDMTFLRWSEVSALIQGAQKNGQQSKVMLPGEIIFEVNSERLVISRKTISDRL